jgi:hypothetical protein
MRSESAKRKRKEPGRVPRVMAMKVKMRVMMSQVTSCRCSRRHSRRAQHEELDLLGAQPAEMKEEPGSQRRSDP